jgi:hypothetical protein
MPGPGITGVLPTTGDEALVLSGDRYFKAIFDTRAGDAASPLIGRVTEWKESGHIKELWGDAPLVDQAFAPWDELGVTAAYVMKGTREQVIISRFRRWARSGNAWAEPGTVVDDWLLNDAAPPQVDGQAPWTGPSGVTATYFTPDQDTFFALSRGTAWRRRTADPNPLNWSWDTGDGGAYNLSDNAMWQAAPPVGGVKPWDGPGVTAAWYIGLKFFVVSVDKMWTHDGRSWTSAELVKDAPGWKTAPAAKCPPE